VQIFSTLDVAIQADTEAAVKKHIDSLQLNLKYRHARRLGMSRKMKLNLDTIIAHFDSIYPIFDSRYIAPERKKPDSLRRIPDSLWYRELQAAAIVIENETGAVRAMVGGLDFKTSKFNRAVQSVLQPGSSFKPFVFAAAMDNGAAPSDSVNDQPITIPDPKDPNKVWRPDNYGKKFSGYMTVREALYRSKNLPAIQIGMKYGLHNLVNYARNFGLKHRLAAVPSLAIGSIGATLMEITSAYTVFPNRGTRIEPYMIEKIESKNGEVLENNFKQESVVLRPPAAYLMVSMMRDVNTRGTAAKIWSSGFHVPSGGKTGTTNDYTDAWYVGFTPKYTMGIWVGIDSHIPMGIGHTGGQAAVPIWTEVMKKAHKDLPRMDFKMPKGITSASICKGTQKLASDLCPASITELFTPSNRPTEAFSEADLNTERKSSEATRFSREQKNTTGRRRTF
jgi:penicillin-binding protein 1A